MANPLSKLFNRNQYIKTDYNLTTPAFLQVLKEAENEDSGAGRKKVVDVFLQHDWANIAIHTIARNIARTDFKLYTPNDEEIEEGDVYDLFNHVNPYMSSSQLWEASSAWIQCRGEFLWLLDKPGVLTIPKEIIVVDPANWTATLNKQETEIVQWVYEDPKSGKKTPYKTEQLIHIKQWNKWNRWRGMNPLIAQVENVEQDYQANISNTSLIKNNSVPLGVITAQQIVSKEQADTLTEQWEANNKGAKKAHKTAVLGKGATYQRIGLMPSEMQYSEMRKWNRNSILARYGIPPIVVGVKDDASALSGSDTAEQEQAFWTKKLIPEMKFIEEALATKFFKRFNLQMKAGFDYTNIPELQEDIHKQIESASKLFAMGFTANEINDRMNLGFEEQPWRDEPFRTSQVEEADPEEVDEPVPPPFPPPAFEPGPQEESAKIPNWVIPFEVASQARWEKLIGSYTTKLKAWFYEIRKWYLENFASLELEERTAKIEEVSQTYIEFMFWADQQMKLHKISEVFYSEAVAGAGADLKVLFEQSGWDLSFDLRTIDAKTIVEDRLFVSMPRISHTINKSMADLIWKASKEGWTQDALAHALRDRFADIANKADVIARTELNIIKSATKAQEMAKKGVEKIRWIHTGRSRISRPHHVRLSGTEVIYGDPFPGVQGMRWPHDVGGPASEVVNCMCDYTIVEKQEV